MPTPPPGRPNPERPLDNEPPPLLTYGSDDFDEFGRKKHAGRGIPRWLWAFLLAVAAGGAAYYFVAGPGMSLTSSSDAPDASFAALPGVGGEATLRPAAASDTAVPPGTPVELPVRATGADGSMLSDVRVRFTIDRGAGTLASEEVWTDPGGIARTTLLTASLPSETVVRASLEGPEAPATHFTVATRTGAAAAMAAVRGDGQEQSAGALLPERLGVRITDADGVPVPGVEVRFEVGPGGGLSAPSLTRTDSLGEASAIWRLGSSSPRQVLTATAPTLGTSVTFTATARDVSAATEEQGSAVVQTSVTEALPSNATAAISVVARDLAVGGPNVCFVSGATVTCRGANDRGQGIRAGAPGATSLAAGLFHGCGLDPSGVASCWGANESGQLGDGSRIDRTTSVPVGTDLRFSVLAAGLAHTCGLTADGRAACWGQNLGGQLGDGSRDDRTNPGLMAGDTRFVDLVAGWNHTCGITRNGDLYCWGLNRDGAVGDGSRLDGLAPRRIAGSVSAVAAGSAHTCAISGGRVLCWGDNGSGQLGDGSTTPHLDPAPVDGLPGAPIALAAGAAHTCVLLADGSAHCWGQNRHGQLGNGGTAGATSPELVVGGHAFERLSAGGNVTCGVAAGGQVYCWGLNQNGQLGDGTFTNRAIPSRVGGV